ncbi:MAG: D-alanyl-D-alanine carboxypeptidase, partial [Paraclostridium sp.]
KKGESKDFTKKIDVNKNLKLPVKEGTKLGSISIYKGDKQVGKVDLINEKDINKASYFKMFERVIDSIF